MLVVVDFTMKALEEKADPRSCENNTLYVPVGIWFNVTSEHWKLLYVIAPVSVPLEVVLGVSASHWTVDALPNNPVAG